MSGPSVPAGPRGGRGGGSAGGDARRAVGVTLVGDVRARLAGTAAPARDGWGDGPELAGHVQAAAVAAGRVLGVGDLRAAVDGVRDHAWGLGALRALVDDPQVTDVLVNGGGAVWVDRGGGLQQVPVRIGGEEQVRALAVRLAAAAGRRLDEAAPWVDARLPGGVRLHAVVPPVSPAGTHLSLRILRGRTLDLDALVSAGSVTPDWRPVLAALVSARAAFLVTGGTGAGKTTLLTALLSLVPADERLLLVEDIGELDPRHPHVVRLEARHANVEGRGAVPLEDLVRQALRMRPDRLVVGECRGAEVRELLAALNTGHEGGCGTLHANSAAEVPARLEALGALAGLSREAVQAQAAAALDAVVHLRRDPRGLRYVAEIAAVRRSGDGGLRIIPALRAGPPEDAAGGGETGTTQCRTGGERVGAVSTGQQAAAPGGRRVGAPGPGWPMLARRLGLPAVPGSP